MYKVLLCKVRGHFCKVYWIVSDKSSDYPWFTVQFGSAQNYYQRGKWFWCLNISISGLHYLQGFL